MHSGTLSLSHCKMLRISGESVSNHHGQINDSNNKQKNHAHLECELLIYTMVQTQPRQSGYCQTCVVSLQDAQNQRGKRFKSSRANQRLKQQAEKSCISRM